MKYIRIEVIKIGLLICTKNFQEIFFFFSLCHHKKTSWKFLVQFKTLIKINSNQLILKANLRNQFLNISFGLKQ